VLLGEQGKREICLPALESERRVPPLEALARLYLKAVSGTKRRGKEAVV